MNRDEKLYYKNKLLKERRKVMETIHSLRQTDSNNSMVEMSSELSFYDNHAGDVAGLLYDMERENALKINELAILNKIDEAIKNLDKDDYGKCKNCGQTIPRDRLEMVPYANLCVSCQKENHIKEAASSFNSRKEAKLPDSRIIDNIGEETYDNYIFSNLFSNIDSLEDYYNDEEGYVEDIEKISNEQYKNQLPD